MPRDVGDVRWASCVQSPILCFYVVVFSLSFLGFAANSYVAEAGI